jgi:hypothetical protein
LLFTIALSGPALASNTMMVGDYQIQVFTDPDPLMAEKEVTITLKILRSQDHTPVRGGKIFLSTKDTFQAINNNELNLNSASEYIEAEEADEFGNYELKTIFSEPDTYYIRVAIKELEGQVINAPLKVGFTINVNPSATSNIKLFFILFTIFSITVAGVYLINVRRKITSIEDTGLNILDVPWLKPNNFSFYGCSGFRKKFIYNTDMDHMVGWNYLYLCTRGKDVVSHVPCWCRIRMELQNI